MKYWITFFILVLANFLLWNLGDKDKLQPEIIEVPDIKVRTPTSKPVSKSREYDFKYSIDDRMQLIEAVPNSSEPFERNDAGVYYGWIVELSGDIEPVRGQISQLTKGMKLGLFDFSPTCEMGLCENMFVGPMLNSKDATKLTERLDKFPGVKYRIYKWLPSLIQSNNSSVQSN